MTTKADERKAMEAIRKIVNGLGENSYIGSAMEGVWEIMEDNIDNDFACSMGYRLEEKDREITGLKARIAKLESDRAEDKEKLREMTVAKNMAEVAESNANEHVEFLKKTLLDTDAKVSDLTARIEDMKATARDRDDLIIRLKAKLYDLMVSDEALQRVFEAV